MNRKRIRDLIPAAESILIRRLMRILNPGGGQGSDAVTVDTKTVIRELKAKIAETPCLDSPQLQSSDEALIVAPERRREGDTRWCPHCEMVEYLYELEWQEAKKSEVISLKGWVYFTRKYPGVQFSDARFLAWGKRTLEIRPSAWKTDRCLKGMNGATFKFFLDLEE